ncbi:MAG: hypothetical protein WA151_16305 [Desulfatirhabdiaceae bacterium]
MPYAAFYNLFPEIAETETRAVTLLHRFVFNLPPASYSFIEMFCDEAGCDCRRVFLCVISSLDEKPKAVIAWGWETEDFYKKWMGSDPIDIDMLKGPSLNLASPQSEIAPALLNLFKQVLLPDQDYIERIKRHYHMFREKIDGKPRAGARISKKSKTKKNR